MTKQKCPECGSDDLRTSAHMFFEKGIYWHSCNKCGKPDDEEKSRTFWKGEKYKHNKYPEANLEKVDLGCSDCDCKTAYVSRHLRFLDDNLAYRCCDCEKVWFEN